MRISVIIPVHDAGKYLAEAVNSVIEQILPDEVCMEVLLIENGSEDDSANICDGFADENDFVHSFHIGRASAYEARQEGIKQATGDFLVFMDADDKMKKDFVSALCSYIKAFSEKGEIPDVILYNAAELSTPDKKMFSFPFFENKIYGPDEKQDFYRLMCSGDSLNAMWNKCLQKELGNSLVENDKKDRRLNHGEDLLQTAAIIDRAKGIAYLDRILYLYRINEEGLTGSYHPEFLDNQALAWQAFDEYACRWTKGEYAGIIKARKSLTCTIGMKKLIYSELGIAEIKRKMKAMMNSAFYAEFAKEKLPEWAPEEDVFVHGLQVAADSEKALIRSCRKHKIKSFIKARIRKNGI
ncbi:glycosyltransferase family 2 protein [Butyrivibrio sp. AE3004]|uniref:glycosyltransferase family 2 protein n=1 Tax=Butyrivibrio sp. AE3004 TaxID=1506994 RepID=UPI000493D732|nr:glycosyltransferase family 2 protein [Butyrivibrio sp. AE3004]